MAIDKFIPEVWSARMTRILEPKLVIAQPRVMNRNWEGEVAEAGDTVHIRNFTTGGTIRDYSRNTAMAAPDRPSDGELLLTVDQQKAFYIAVDDVDAAQADITIMDKFLERTVRNLALVLDKFAAVRIINGAHANNVIGTVAAPQIVNATGTGTGAMTPYKFCVEARKRLQKQSTPGDDRWMIINADLEAEFLQDPRLVTDITQGGDSSVIRNGAIGRMAGFDILTTEAVPTAFDLNLDGDTGDVGETEGAANLAVLYGDSNYGLTWADQVVKVEAERLQGQFSDALKGLNVYGAKVVEGASLGVAHVSLD